MTYKIQIGDPVALVNNIAGMYQSPTRVFMEYIDNSLDDAEELYRSGNSEYPYHIKIKVNIDTKKKEVAFLDNCRGMGRQELIRIITDIGKSHKKAQPWTNGQFGFGVHAFRACAEEMEVISRKNGSTPLKILIRRHEIDVQKERGADPALIPFPSGTKVTLREFEKEWWNEVSAETLKEEIERHFEGLLGREKISIVVSRDGETVTCDPFDYHRVPGKEFRWETSEFLDKSSGRGKSGLVTDQFPEPLVIYLKVTDIMVPNKRPIFVNKGRRIEEVQLTKSYTRAKSKYKTALWGHPHLIGFIEANGIIEPTLARDDFRRGKYRTLVYQKLVDIEEEINETLQRSTRGKESESWSNFENIISAAVAQLSREDSMRFRKGLAKGEHLKLSLDEGGDEEVEVEGEPDAEGDRDKVERGRTKKEKAKEDEKGKISKKPRKKTGFDVKLLDWPLEQITDTEGKVNRSIITDGTIGIFIRHPDFQERIERTRQGEPKINQRLLFYISGIVGSHYKDKFYEKSKLQPETQRVLARRMEMLEDYLEFMCKLENLLQPYVGKGLFTLEVPEQRDND